MDLTPETDNYLTPAQIDAKFVENGMLAHFQHTCKPRTVNTPKAQKRLPVPKWRKKGTWEYVEFRDTNDVTQCKYKKRDRIDGDEVIGENVHIVWYRDTDGKKHVSVTVDATLIEGA